jgi:hypothetical protein
MASFSEITDHRTGFYEAPVAAAIEPSSFGVDYGLLTFRGAGSPKLEKIYFKAAEREVALDRMVLRDDQRKRIAPLLPGRSWKSRRPRALGDRQAAFRRSRAPGRAGRSAVTRPAGVVRFLELGIPALSPVGPRRCLRTALHRPGRRRGLRVRDHREPSKIPGSISEASSPPLDPTNAKTTLQTLDMLPSSHEPF